MFVVALERGDQELFRTSKNFEIRSATAENESFKLRDKSSDLLLANNPPLVVRC